MSVGRFYTPQPIERFVRAKAEDVNNNLDLLESGFRAVAGELDAIVPDLNAALAEAAEARDEAVAAAHEAEHYATTMSQVGWTAPALASNEEFQLLAIPADGWTFPANFALNAGVLRGTPPATDFIVTVRHVLANGSDNGVVGTITIKANRSIVRATSGGTAKTLPGGGGLLFVGPATAQGVTYFAERMQPSS